MAKKKKKFNAKTKIVAAIRRIYYHSAFRRNLAVRAKVDKDYYRCEKCRKLCEKVEADHINPVVPLTGWAGYDTFVENLFCDESNIQILCEPCHGKKTAFEATERKRHRALAKGKKDE